MYLIARIKKNPTVRQLARAVGWLPSKAANPDHYHGDVAKGYLEKRLQQKSWHREQEVVQALVDRMPEGIAVLDVPVGTGRFVPMCLARGMSVTGVDISQDMLDMARGTLGADYGRCKMIRGSADALPFDAGRFDLVICFRFFGLIPLALSNRVLGEIRRVCAASAQVIIRVPVRKNGAPALPPALGEEPLGGRLYEPELVEMFAAHGLTVLDKHSVDEREQVSYLVYLLGLRPV